MNRKIISDERGSKVTRSPVVVYISMLESRTFFYFPNCHFPGHRMHAPTVPYCRILSARRKERKIQKRSVASVARFFRSVTGSLGWPLKCRIKHGTTTVPRALRENENNSIAGYLSSRDKLSSLFKRWHGPTRLSGMFFRGRVRIRPVTLWRWNYRGVRELLTSSAQYPIT